MFPHNWSYYVMIRNEWRIHPYVFKLASNHDSYLIDMCWGFGMSPLATWLIKTCSAWMCHPAIIRRSSVQTWIIPHVFSENDGETLNSNGFLYNMIPTKITIWIHLEGIPHSQKTDHFNLTQFAWGTLYRIRHDQTMLHKMGTVRLCKSIRTSPPAPPHWDVVWSAKRSQWGFAEPAAMVVAKGRKSCWGS